MISVVINTKNEEKNIGRCLESLKDQTDTGFEVWVVDNRSTDGTRVLAKNFGAEVLEFGPERSAQKNFGAQKARADFLLFLDADMTLSPRVLAACGEEIEKGFEALVIPEFSVGQGFWAECRSLEKKLYLGDDRIEAPRFFRKETFVRVGGYSEELVAGEDWDLREKLKKIGARIGRIKEPLYHHEGQVSFRAALKKKFYYGRQAGHYLSRNRITLTDLLLFIFRPAYGRHLKYLFTDPGHFFGLLILKSGELAAGFAGLIFGKFL